MISTSTMSAPHTPGFAWKLGSRVSRDMLTYCSSSEMTHNPEPLSVRNVRDLVTQRTHINLDCLFQPTTRRFQSLPTSPKRCHCKQVKQHVFPDLSPQRYCSVQKKKLHKGPEGRSLQTFLPLVIPPESLRDQLVRNSLRLLNFHHQLNAYLLQPNYLRRRRHK